MDDPNRTAPLTPRARRLAQYIATVSVCAAVGTNIALLMIYIASKIQAGIALAIFGTGLLVWLWLVLQAVLLVMLVARRRTATAVCSALLLPTAFVNSLMFLLEGIQPPATVWTQFGLSVLTVLPQLAATINLIRDRAYWSLTTQPVTALTSRRCWVGLVLPAGVAQLVATLVVPALLPYPSNALYAPVLSLTGWFVALVMYELVVDRGLPRVIWGVGFAVIMLSWLSLIAYISHGTARVVLAGYDVAPTRSPVETAICACWPIAAAIMGPLIVAAWNLYRRSRDHAEAGVAR